VKQAAGVRQERKDFVVPARLLFQSDAAASARKALLWAEKSSRSVTNEFRKTMGKDAAKKARTSPILIEFEVAVRDAFAGYFLSPMAPEPAEALTRFSEPLRAAALAAFNRIGRSRDGVYHSLNPEYRSRFDSTITGIIRKGGNP
jgi:hypothetical protein